jgi:hypothetical protein
MTIKSLFEAVYRRLTANSALLCCLLLLVASCVLALKPAQEHSYQRFVPFPGLDSGSTVVLDTKTGLQCVSAPTTLKSPVSQSNIADNARERGAVLCYDLYKAKK